MSAVLNATMEVSLTFHHRPWGIYGCIGLVAGVVRWRLDYCSTKPGMVKRPSHVMLPVNLISLVLGQSYLLPTTPSAATSRRLRQPKPAAPDRSLRPDLIDSTMLNCSIISDDNCLFDGAIPVTRGAPAGAEGYRLTISSFQ